MGESNRRRKRKRNMQNGIRTQEEEEEEEATVDVMILEVKVYGANKVIDKTIYQDPFFASSRRSYYLYAGLSSVEAIMHHDYDNDSVTIVLDPRKPVDRCLKLEIVQVRCKLLEIGTSNGMSVVGRTQVPIPLLCFDPTRHRVEVVKMCGVDPKPNGYVDVVIEKKMGRRRSEVMQ